MAQVNERTLDLSNPEHVHKLAADDVDREADLGWIASTPRGRRWLYGLIFETCGLTRGAADLLYADVTSFQLGRQDVGEQLFVELKTNHREALLLMLKENL